MSVPSKLILASASPRRLMLLAQIGVTPDEVIPADMDETPRRKESATEYATRIALEKARHVAALPAAKGALVLSADTVVEQAGKILGKAQGAEDVTCFLNRLSGKKHRVITVMVMISPDGKTAMRQVITKIRFKRLALEEIRDYAASGEGEGKAGGYAIQGLAAKFAIEIQGSYSAVVGLPLYETSQLLTGMGYFR